MTHYKILHALAYQKWVRIIFYFVQLERIGSYRFPNSSSSSSGNYNGIITIESSGRQFVSGNSSVDTNILNNAYVYQGEKLTIRTHYISFVDISGGSSMNQHQPMPVPCIPTALRGVRSQNRPHRVLSWLLIWVYGVLIRSGSCRSLRTGEILRSVSGLNMSITNMRLLFRRQEQWSIQNVTGMVR